MTRLHNFPLSALHAELRAADAAMAAAKECKADALAELERRYRADMTAAFDAADKSFGTITLAADGAYEIVGVIAKEVKWDSAKLLDVASTMPWEQVQRLFKVTFEVPERTYSGVAAADPDLRARLDTARTVRFREKPIELRMAEKA